MRFDLKFSLAVLLLSGAVAGCASIPDQTAAAPPGTVNEGTLAESAATTALATSTYNQPAGFLPGMKP